MAYEYRRLTPEEREEVLQRRREAGYPLHSPPHPFRGPAHYLITAANYEHVAIMAPVRSVGPGSRLPSWNR
jgi:putative transposase